MARCAQVAKLAKLAATGPAASGQAGLQPSIQRCLGRLPQLQGSDVVDLTRSLARLRWTDEATWKDIGSVVTQKVEEMKVAELVKVAGAFSVASQPDTEMLKAMMGRVKAAPRGLKSWSWGDFIVSLQRAAVKPDKELLKAAADAILKDLDSFRKIKTPYIMGFVDASLRAGFFHQGMFHVLSEVVMERLESLSPYELSKVALTWGQANYKDDALVQSLCKAIHTNLPAFPKNRISYTIHGLCLLDCKDKQLLLELASAWAAKGPEPIQVPSVICGLARLGALDPALCNQIAACSLHCVPHFNAKSVAAILLACAQSGCTHTDFLDSLGKAASLKISEFSTQDLCAASFAGAKLSLAPILGVCIPGAALKRVSDFRADQLALMMHAVSRLSDSPCEYLQVLEHAILPHVPTLTPVDLRYISMAWTQARVSTEKLREAYAARTIDMIDELDPATISHITWAHSKLQVSNVDLFKALGVRCAASISSFNPSRLGCIASAFVDAGVHDEVPLISIARQALRYLGQMHPIPASHLARAFIQADLESSEITALLESLASVARQQEWTRLSPSHFEQTDFQKQCAQTVQDFLPGQLLSLVLPHCDGSHLNLEVDPLDLQLCRLDRAARTRRDQFLEDLGVQVLRLKVRDQDDLRYHLLQIFGHPADPSVDDSPEELPASEVGPLDEEAVAMCGHVWNEMEPGRVQHESLL
ncbi:unnamed protein product [Cladocopium goreaui]|uniref:Pseudouridine synthase RsuA/RluA-like domain-containing protein n=1 Tax=Cladocopium goreaui TaxID=2562237 RepID=A0A9P1D447_9DINO|nr:unnamed protein product [Cladocopium goreaui]